MLRDTIWQHSHIIPLSKPTACSPTCAHTTSALARHPHPLTEPLQIRRPSSNLRLIHLMARAIRSHPVEGSRQTSFYPPRSPSLAARTRVRRRIRPSLLSLPSYHLSRASQAYMTIKMIKEPALKAQTREAILLSMIPASDKTRRHGRQKIWGRKWSAETIIQETIDRRTSIT